VASRRGRVDPWAVRPDGIIGRRYDVQRFRRGKQHGQRRLRPAHVPGQQDGVVVHGRHVRDARAQDT